MIENHSMKKELRYLGFIPEQDPVLSDLAEEKRGFDGRDLLGGVFQVGSEMPSEEIGARFLQTAREEVIELVESNQSDRGRIAKQIFPPVFHKRIVKRFPEIPKDPIEALDFFLDCPYALAANLLRERANWFSHERSPELEQYAKESFELHKEPLFSYLGDRFAKTEEERLLLRKRLDDIRIVVVDPVMAKVEKNSGSWTPMTRTIRISGEFAPGDIDDVLVHEMIHAMSSSLMRKESLTDDGDDLDASETDQTGMHVDARSGVVFRSQEDQEILGFLNEGITEGLATHYISQLSDENLRKRFRERSGKDGSEVYKEEVSLFKDLHAPEKMGVSGKGATKLKGTADMSRAIERAKEAGAYMNQADFDMLLGRAYLFDSYVGDSGYADHFREWSKAMRLYYGDNVLSHLTRTWKRYVEHSWMSKGPDEGCKEMLAKSFLQKWGEPPVVASRTDKSKRREERWRKSRGM